jgi:hypothetical protein
VASGERWWIVGQWRRRIAMPREVFDSPISPMPSALPSYQASHAGREEAERRGLGDFAWVSLEERDSEDVNGPASVAADAWPASRPEDIDDIRRGAGYDDEMTGDDVRKASKPEWSADAHPREQEAAVRQEGHQISPICLASE